MCCLTLNSIEIWAIMQHTAQLMNANYVLKPKRGWWREIRQQSKMKLNIGEDSSGDPLLGLHYRKLHYLDTVCLSSVYFHLISEMSDWKDFSNFYMFKCHI